MLKRVGLAGPFFMPEIKCLGNKVSIVDFIFDIFPYENYITSLMDCFSFRPIR